MKIYSFQYNIELCYNVNSRLTLEAFKKLERGANIPVLTGHFLTESKLENIMEYLEFPLCHSRYRNAPLAVQCIESWISQYKAKECKIEPTWCNLFDALKHVKLDPLEKDIEECLRTKTVHVAQTEVNKGT